MLEYTLENELYEQGFKAVCGVDEAGRGPLCGPVVTAAVILPCGLYIEGLNDSKKLTEKKREKLLNRSKMGLKTKTERTVQGISSPLNEDGAKKEVSCSLHEADVIEQYADEE